MADRNWTLDDLPIGVYESEAVPSAATWALNDTPIAGESFQTAASENAQDYEGLIPGLFMPPEAASGDINVPVTGVSAAFAIGSASVTADANTTQTGVTSPAVLGNESVTADANASVTGVASATALGNESVTADANTSGAGVASTALLGSVSVTADGTAQVTGVASASALGSVTVDTGGVSGDVSVPVNGVQASFAVGIVGVEAHTQQGGGAVIRMRANVVSHHFVKDSTFSATGVCATLVCGNVIAVTSSPMVVPVLSVSAAAKHGTVRVRAHNRDEDDIMAALLAA